VPQHENRVTLIRHGETEWSKSGQHTGITDIPLTDHGREEARQTGALIAGQRFELVLRSPLLRAWETADLVGLGEVAEVDDDLREWNYGDYEGIATVEIQKTHPGWTVWRGPLPNGETPDQVGERVDRVIARARAVEGPVALVGHGHCLRILSARWCELPAVEGRRLQLSTATLSILGWEHDVPGLVAWNAAGVRS
jgi:probable phosphoglycerate mutase